MVKKKVVKKRARTTKVVRKHKKKTKINNLFLGLLVVLGLVLMYNVFSAINLSSVVGEKIAEAEESAKPAELQMFVITNVACSDCYDIVPVVDSVRNAGVNLIEERELSFDSEEAKELISKYGVEKIPAVLLLGEINKTGIANFVQKDDALVFNNVLPPYSDTDGTVLGLVTSTLITDSSCAECGDLTLFLAQLEQSGIKIVDKKTFDKNSVEGQALIETYEVTKLPVFVLSKDAGVYQSISEGWRQLGSIERDGSYVFRTTQPPYLDLASDAVKGLVDVIYLDDAACEECYDVAAHKPILQNLGLSLSSERIADVSSDEGQSLVEKYGITFVPTIILSEGAGLYPGISAVWSSVGKVADDGSYIFTEVKVMRGKYKDLSTGEVKG